MPLDRVDQFAFLAVGFSCVCIMNEKRVPGRLFGKSSRHPRMEYRPYWMGRYLPHVRMA